MWVPSPIFGAGVLHGGLRPEDVARAYEIESLHNAGFHGEGQTVAIMSLGAFNPDDIAAFDQAMGITGPAVQSVRLPGADTAPSKGYVGEVSLDIEAVRGIAPPAQLINYEAAPDLASFGPLMSRIVDDGRADLVNVSYGWCERYWPTGVIASNEQEFAAAFAQGISVFVSSGDEGAYECWRVPRNEDDPFDRDIAKAVASPTSSPHVISVGGTYLSVREDGTYFQEFGWEEPLGTSGTGGGLSEIYDRPAWQVGAGVDNAESNGKRQVPDVAGPADPASGFIVYFTIPGEEERTITTVGGTSASAPFWVGSMALTRQLANSKGIATLGALGPLLYQVAAARPDVFHDVVKGGNLLHQAGPAWDYATGLGTPRVGPLADAIINALGGQ
jgi:kumamolisin